jgi:hypothetical protein
VINEVLDAEGPQLVVLNGDLITGTNAYVLNSTTTLDQITAPLVECGLTWASTYGNHDSAFNLSRLDILVRERTYPNARTSQMVFRTECGVSNYYLPVYLYDYNTSSAPSLLLWFFDSRGGQKFQQLDSQGSMISEPDWVDQSVVNWFQKTNTQLSTQYGKAIPSLAFVHIPTNASRVLQTEVGVDPHRQPGIINADNVLSGQAQGWCAEGSNESCSNGGQDFPFMEAIATTPGLMAVFSGHDHEDSWCYRWAGLLPGMSMPGNGVNLCFDQHSGYGGYGTWIRGSRQVLVTEEMLSDLAFET